MRVILRPRTRKRMTKRGACMSGAVPRNFALLYAEIFCFIKFFKLHHGLGICSERLDCDRDSIIDICSLHCTLPIVLESTRQHSRSYTRGLDLMVRMLLRCNQAWPVRLED